MIHPYFALFYWPDRHTGKSQPRLVDIDEPRFENCHHNAQDFCHRFEEDIEVHKRMSSIGEIIMWHDYPDFICLQVSDCPCMPSLHAMQNTTMSVL